MFVSVYTLTLAHKSFFTRISMYHYLSIKGKRVSAPVPATNPIRVQFRNDYFNTFRIIHVLRTAT